MNLRRKRMMLMDGQWYGYLRTASGNPLTLQNAKRLRKLTIYGNAVQDGTPSPDAPVEVQLCGDRTGNLWDRAYSDVDANWVGNPGGYRYLNLKLKENTTYTLFVKQNNMHEGYSDYWDSDDNVVAFYIGENPNTWNGNTIFGNTTNNNPKQVYSFTTTEAPYYFNLYIRNYNDITVKQVFDELLPGIMLVEGSYTADTLPAYEPYGYKVSGRAEGLNLFNEKDFGAQTGVITNDDGSFTLPSNNEFKYDIQVKNSATYTLSVICNNTINYACLLLRFLNEDKQEVGQVYLKSDNSPYVLQRKDVNYIRIADTWSSKYTINFKNFQIVQGSYTAETMPSYEPYQPPQEFAVYLPEQIAKVGDVADEVVVDMEKQTAELKKNVGSMTMSDSYSGGISITDELVRFYHGTTPLRRISPSTNIIDVMSDIYEADTWKNLGAGSTDKQFVIAGNPNTQVVNVRVPKSVIGGETNELMNAWAANNPATVYYVLATPVTTDITSLQQWDAMPQVSGTVTLTLSAEVDPSGAEAVYYSKERGE